MEEILQNENELICSSLFIFWGHLENIMLNSTKYIMLIEQEMIRVRIIMM